MFAGDPVLSATEKEFAGCSADLVGLLARRLRTEEELSPAIQDLFVVLV
jgi:hypothetical protein